MRALYLMKNVKSVLKKMISQVRFFRSIMLLGIILSISCNADDRDSNAPTNTLELLASYNIDVQEPSGLTIDVTGTVLYTVSDNTGAIYKLSTQGNLLEVFELNGDDLEGVSTFTENKLLLAEEESRQIVEYKMNTGTISRHTIDYESNGENSGIEGVSYKENNGSIFILNEKDPGKLIQLSTDFSIIAEYDLNFASDYSGIFYDSSLDNLWILSDQSKSLNRCTLTGVLIERYPININKAEGVAITNNEIFIVSDQESKLYAFKKPQV